MIRFDLRISNPWHKPNPEEPDSKDFFYKHKTLSKNKSFEIQISKWYNQRDIFQFELDLNWNGSDHAGPHFQIEVFGYMFDVKIYDHRHWDWEFGQWEVYDESEDHSSHH